MRAHTVRARVPLVPEIELHLATELTPIWQATELWLEREGIEPPFWAFAWPGSQAIARHILDHPACVRARRVLDFASGSGLAAIAASLAGAASVEASELDPLAVAAIAINAATNRAAVAPLLADVTASEDRWDLILCGDVCYAAPMTALIMPWLRRAAGSGAEVWIADPGRAYLPTSGLTRFGPEHDIPTSRELEDRERRPTRLYRVDPGLPLASHPCPPAR